MVNCVGVIKRRAEAVSPIPSITISSLLPHKLDHMASVGADAAFISVPTAYSTASVGAVSKKIRPGDVYARTKFLGEVAAANTHTLRTSSIGRKLTEQRTPLDWFLAQSRNTVRG